MIPAQAGIHKPPMMLDPGFRRDDARADAQSHRRDAGRARSLQQSPVSFQTGLALLRITKGGGAPTSANPMVSVSVAGHGGRLSARHTRPF